MKRNLTPIVFLVSSALFSLNANAIECQNPVNIKNTQNAVLNQCKLTEEGRNEYRSAVSVSDSINTQISDLSINYNLPNSIAPISLLSINNSTTVINNSALNLVANENAGSTGIQVENSTLTLNNTNVMTKQGKEGQTTPLDIIRSNVTVNGGEYKVIANDYATTFVMRLNNSNVTLNDVTLSSNSELDYIILENNNNLTVNNLTLAEDGLSSVFTAFNSGNKLTINNTNITKTKLGEMVGFSWGVNNQNEQYNFDVEINDSTLKSQVFIGDTEDEEVINKKVALNINSSNSTLSGTIINENGGHVNLNLKDSTWTLPTTFNEKNYSSTINNLSLTNSNIILSNNNGFQTLTIKDNLSGTGTFTLNTNLAQQQSDLIDVKGKAEGDFKLNVQDSGEEPNTANGKVTLVKTNTGDAKFSLANRDYVDAGAYRYRLNKEGNDWVLSNKASESSQTNPTTVDPTPVTPTDNTGSTVNNNNANTNSDNNSATLMLSERTNALVSLRQAQFVQLEQNLLHIHQRLSEHNNAQNGEVWVNYQNGRNRFESTSTGNNSQSSGFDQDTHSVQLGADGKVMDNLFIGGFIGHSRSDVDFKQNYGSGKIRSQIFGLYSHLFTDYGYWDNVAKYERIKSTSDSTGDRHYNAYSLSSEIGKVFEFGLHNAKLFITPKAQLAYSTISGQADEDRLNLFTSRIGARMGINTQLAGVNLQPYVEVNGVTSKVNSNQVQVNQYQFDVASSRGRIETALGINANTGNHRFGIEAKTSHGKRLDQPLVLQAVYGYRW